MRVAVYATPAPESDLGRLAALWLGRDPFTGEATRPADPARDPVVADPARYGFHATLRAPFRLAEGVGIDDVAERLAGFCATWPALSIRRLVLSRLGDFFALVPGAPEPSLHGLEAAVLDAFEPLRAPITEAEIARRRPERLTERQRDNLHRWGYPFVREAFRFHMTLTGPVPGPADDLRQDLESHFAAILDRPLLLDGLGLFVEDEPGAPFRVHAFHPFGPATGSNRDDPMSEQVFRNAAIVLGDEVIHGSLLVRDGRIAEIASGASSRGEDLGGDTLIPGLVELHTDHIEGHYLPRPKVRWNMMAALQAHDAQIAASGITTVFDAIRVGMDEDALLTSSDMLAMAETIGAAAEGGRLRADHYIHLRCEVSTPDVLSAFEAISRHSRIRLVSLMDHAPGQRQFVDLDTYRSYYQRKMNLTDEAFAAFCRRRVGESETHSAPNRRVIAGACRAAGIAVASHDDATEAHVREGIEIGITLAEFPTTVEAALTSRQAGLHVLMGAPNIVRGGSHSGNVSAADLLGRGALDILSSDYVPFSLLQSAFLLADGGTLDLPSAIRLVATNPAAAARLDDRGAIAPGLRADLVRIRTDGAHPPLVVGVWREGRRVA